MRTLLIFIALAVIVTVGKRLWQQRRPPPRHTRNGRMVQCAHCAIYIPEQEAIRQDGRWFCSPQHRDAAGA